MGVGSKLRLYILDYSISVNDFRHRHSKIFSQTFMEYITYYAQAIKHI